MNIRQRRAGFTLIECLVAAVILGIGVVGVASMFTYASLSEKKAAFMAQARDIAEQTLEEVRSNGYAVFTEPSGSQSIDTSQLPHSSGLLAWQPYPDAGAESGLKLVAINVSWQWAATSGGEYRLATLVAQ